MNQEIRWMNTREILDKLYPGQDLRDNLLRNRLSNKLQTMFAKGLIVRRRDPDNPAHWQWLPSNQVMEYYLGQQRLLDKTDVLMLNSGK